MQYERLVGMIKDCKIKYNNAVISIADFDGVDVQIPAVDKDKKSVKIKYEHGNYYVMPDDYVEDTEFKETFINKSGKKKNKKATRELIIDEEIYDENN